MTTCSIEPGVAYTFEFTNYRSEVTQRVVIARALQWGDTPWHTEQQFFLDAFDLEKQETRQFPLSGIRLASFRRYIDPELDVFLTAKQQAAELRGVEKGLADAAEKETVRAASEG